MEQVIQSSLMSKDLRDHDSWLRSRLSGDNRLKNVIIFVMRDLVINKSIHHILDDRKHPF